MDAEPLPFDPIEEAKRHWSAHGWSEVADAMGVVTSVMRVQQLYLARVESTLRPYGLTFSRFEVLALLVFSRKGAMPLGRIGSRLQVHPASVTNAIDRLEAGGLVVRERHAGDGRTRIARITDEGRQRFDSAVGALNAGPFSDIGLDERQAREVTTLLRAVRRSAGDF